MLVINDTIILIIIIVSIRKHGVCFKGILGNLRQCPACRGSFVKDQPIREAFSCTHNAVTIFIASLKINETFYNVVFYIL